jgi:glycosyltransferase involved in cell wall biosynthesis
MLRNSGRKGARMTLPLVSVMVPCYNEEGNVEVLYERVCEVLQNIPGIRFQFVFIDNSSTDRTPELLRAMAARDARVKVIFNIRNFGPLRSPLHGFFESPGDALVCMACDLQDPPEMLADFVRHWRDGFKVVVGVKRQSRESWLMFFLRGMYYRTLSRISETPLIDNFTGFGLYDREVVEMLRRIPDRRPYFRGLIAELGFARAEVPFVQPRRERGVTKNNFFALYDAAMTGLTSHSRLPLRFATIAGFVLGTLSLLVAIGYLIMKLLFWNRFALGQAPLIFGVFFLGSVQLFFIGILGEYIGAMHAQMHPRPWVVERERLNFDKPSAKD